MKSDDFKICKLGLTKYNEAYEQQLAVHRAVACGEQASTILYLEHPRVITLGKNAQPRFILKPEALALQNIEIIRTDRGGEVTAHEPGQLVVYPVLNLRVLKLGPREYVTILEDSVIAALERFGVYAHKDQNLPGVWVGSRKICAVGIRIKNGVSYHGIAVNISNSLEIFSYIQPCGIAGRGLCSLSQIAKKEVSIEEFAFQFLEVFRAKIFKKPT